MPKLKKKLMMQFQENNQTEGRTERQKDGRTEGHKDGQTLFQRTLLVTAGCPKSFHEIVNDKIDIINIHTTRPQMLGITQKNDTRFLHLLGSTQRFLQENINRK